MLRRIANEDPTSVRRLMDLGADRFLRDLGDNGCARHHHPAPRPVRLTDAVSKSRPGPMRAVSLPFRVPLTRPRPRPTVAAVRTSPPPSTRSSPSGRIRARARIPGARPIPNPDARARRRRPAVVLRVRGATRRRLRRSTHHRRRRRRCARGDRIPDESRGVRPRAGSIPRRRRKSRRGSRRRRRTRRRREGRLPS